MPEEINRLLTDALADLRLVSEPSSGGNLRREGVSHAKIRLVGNVMIDTLLTHLPAARAQQATRRLGLDDRAYAWSRSIARRRSRDAGSPSGSPP